MSHLPIAPASLRVQWLILNKPLAGSESRWPQGVAWRALNDLREASLKRSPAERISSKDDLGHGHAFDTDE